VFCHRAHAQNDASEVDVIGSAAVDVRLLPVRQNDERRLQTRRDGHVEKGFIAEGDAVVTLRLLARHGRYIPCGSLPADSDARAQRDTHQGGGAQPQAPRQHQPRQGQHGEQHPSRRMQQARNRAPAPCRHEPGQQHPGRQHDADQPLGPDRERCRAPSERNPAPACRRHFIDRARGGQQPAAWHPVLAERPGRMGAASGWLCTAPGAAIGCSLPHRPGHRLSVASCFPSRLQ